MAIDKCPQSPTVNGKDVCTFGRADAPKAPTTFRHLDTSPCPPAPTVGGKDHCTFGA